MSDRADSRDFRSTPVDGVVPAVVSGRPLESPSGVDTLADFLPMLASRYGSAPALLTRYGRWTFSDLASEAERVRRAVAALGVRPGDRVGVVAANGFPWLTTVFGIMASGSVAVPLHMMMTAEDVERAVTLSGCRYLVLADRVGTHAIAESYLARYPDLLVDGDVREGQTPDALTVLVALQNGKPISCQPWLEALRRAESADLPPAAPPRPQDHALVLFTSGTSGAPKAVLHTHRAPCMQMWPWVDAQRVGSADTVFSAYPFCWSSGFVRSMCATLAIGATLVTVDHFQAEEVLALIESHRCTILVLPGAHLDQRLIDSPDFAKRDLSSARRATPMMARALGVAPLGYTGYGMTETFTLISVGRIDDPSLPHTPDWVGSVLPGWTVRISDFDDSGIVSRGNIGRIEVSGPALMLEYLGRPRSDYFTDDGFFRTPDSGYIDSSGDLHFSGRTDDIIRTGGANVSTAEIEAVLREHAGVRLSVALGLPHPTLGQALVCALVPARQDLGAEAVLEWLRERVASYKVPRAVFVLDESELTFTVSQKVQRSSLRELLERRVAESELW